MALLRTARGASALLAAGVLVAGALGAAAGPAVADDGGFTIEDPRITESSGLAASRAHPGVYWTHNDQDGPRVFAVDGRTGRTVATVTLRGIGTPRDMEAVSVGPDGAVYVGDIGDNLNGTWDHVWIYRFPEPKELGDRTVDATQYTVRYADGPRDAEALMVHPKTGRVYIASKNEDGGGLYEGPARLSAAGANVFRRVGEVPWVTDGAFSPDGTELVLRSYFSARAYAWEGRGRLGEEKRVSAPLQRQSESVTYTLDGKALMIGSEGVGSEVVRVPVERDPGPGQTRTPAPGSPSDGGGSADGGSGGGASGDGGNATLGALVLGAIAVGAFWLRRGRGRRPRG